MVPNPHDTLFKAVLAQLEHARGVLQTVVRVALGWWSSPIRVLLARPQHPR